jgi:hypothetical protein
MIRVEYIGLKATKTDNVAGTATVWHGAGDVQEVKPEVWAKLRPYDTVWREATDQSATLHLDPAPTLADATGGTEDTPPADAPKYAIEWEDGETTYTITLDDMDADAIHAFLSDKGLKVDARIRNIDTLRAAAFKAATGA